MTQAREQAGAHDGTGPQAPGADPPRVRAGGRPVQVTSRATCLLAPNPGPMTFEGTNSWRSAPRTGT